jgi:hypothetical protein
MQSHCYSSHLCVFSVLSVTYSNTFHPDYNYICVCVVYAIFILLSNYITNMLVKFSKYLLRLILVCVLLLFSLYITITGGNEDPKEANLNITQVKDDAESPYTKQNCQIRLTCEKYGLGSDAIKKNSTPNKYQVMEKNAWVSPEKTLLHLPQWSLLYCWIRKAASTDLVKHKMKEENLHEAAAFFRPHRENL